jgi:hypothetical protein
MKTKGEKGQHLQREEVVRDGERQRPTTGQIDWWA